MSNSDTIRKLVEYIDKVEKYCEDKNYGQYHGIRYAD